MSDPRTRQAELQAEYDGYLRAGLKLDLTRGKPSPEQLDLSSGLDGILEGFYLLQDGTDVRNYGNIPGIPEARKLGSEILDCRPEQTLVGGSSSLHLMYNYVHHKLADWGDKAKFICQVPGFDRHFSICEHFGIDMIPVAMLADGPDMPGIRARVAEDPDIKGIWCVPKYSNPTGHTYGEDTVRAFAQLPQQAGPDFRVFWDNAYAVHDVEQPGDRLHSLMREAESAGTCDSIVMLASTSKITFAGSGISFLATGENSLAAFEQFLALQVICFDKVNQLRHVRFLKDMDGLRAHMGRHGDLIKPRFDLVLGKLEDKLGGKQMATWTRPRGGYFISVDTRPGLAGTIVEMAAAAGVKLTPAGATFPYGRDPENRNIRIAPTYPGLPELGQAMDIFVNCVELASLNAELD